MKVVMFNHVIMCYILSIHDLYIMHYVYSICTCVTLCIIFMPKTSRFQYVVMLYKISNLQVSTSPFVRIIYHVFEEGNIMLWHWIYDILDTGNCALSYTTLYQ